MKRRRFIQLMAVTALLPWAVGGWLFRKAASAVFIRAGKGRSYPGRVVPLKESEVARPGRWLG